MSNPANGETIRIEDVEDAIARIEWWIHWADTLWAVGELADE